MRTHKICYGPRHTGSWNDTGIDWYYTLNVDNITQVNRGCFSEDYHFPGSHLYWLEKIGYPILLGLSTIGNMLAVLAFIIARPSTSKYLFLGAICVANFIYMWSQLPFYFYNVTPEVRDTDSFRVFFERSEGIWRFLTDTYVTFSDWMLIMFTCERLASLCAKRSYSKRSNRGAMKATFCIFAVLIGAIFYALYDLIDYYWHYHHPNNTDQQSDELPYALRIWRHMQQLAIVCVPIGTYGAILLLNAVAIVVILIRRRDYPAPLNVARHSTAGDLNRLLLASFILYVICVMPMFQLDILVLLDMFRLYDMPVQSRMYQIWYQIAIFMLNINYSINFWMYLIASPAVRKALRQVFCCCCPGSNGSNMGSSHTGVLIFNHANPTLQVDTIKSVRVSRHIPANDMVV